MFFICQLNRAQKIFLYLGMPILLMAFYSYIVIKPLYGRLHYYQQILQELGEQYQVANELTQQLQQYRDHIEQLKRGINKYVHYHDSLTQTIAILLKKHSLTVVDIVPYNKGQEGVVNIRVKGDYRSLLRFIDALGSIPVLFNIKDLRVQSHTDALQYDIKMSLEVVSVASM